VNDYQNKPVDTPNPAQPLGLAVPDRVRAAMAEIVGNMEEGPLALVVGAGLQVMQALRDADVTKLAGPKGRHHSARTAARRGTGSRVAHPRASAGPGAAPSVPAVDGGGELDVPASEPFSSIDLLGRMAMRRCSRGCLPARTRSAWTSLGPVGVAVEAEASSTSRSAMSRRFVAATETARVELLSADLFGAGPDRVHGRWGALR
jgi:putative transposase